MSRASRLPYHQNIYDLFEVVGWKQSAEAAAQIREWEQLTGRSFPAAMTEFYTTSVTIRPGGDAPGDWTPTLPELWSEYSNDERAAAVPEVFRTYEPEPWQRIPAPAVSGFELIWENQGNWVMCARDDGAADPPVDVSGPCFLSPAEMWYGDGDAWHVLGPFSEMLFSWLSHYYQEEFTPISWCHKGWETRRPEQHAPPKPYRNGLWLRAPAEPFEPAVIDYLTEQLDEPERAPRPGNVTTHTFRPPGGTVRITADEPGLAGGLSAWWLHADTADRLAELARLVLPFGTLRATLRADTDPGRRVLKAIM